MKRKLFQIAVALILAYVFTGLVPTVATELVYGVAIAAAAAM